MTKSKKKAKRLGANEPSDDDGGSNKEEDEEEYECNCCGIRHKRLDDLIAKVGFIVHLVIMLMEFYRGRWAWWLNLGSLLCYLSLIYGISLKRWLLYLPYLCANPLLVILQVVQLLRTSYRGHGLDEGLWTAFWNFVTLTFIVVLITAIHVFSILIVLMRFQPFSSYVEKKRQSFKQRGGADEESDIASATDFPARTEKPKRDAKPNKWAPLRVLAEFPKREASADRSVASRRDTPTDFPAARAPISPILKSPQSPRSVTFSPRQETFYYPAPTDESPVRTTALPPLTLERPYHPGTRAAGVSRDSVV